MKISYDRINSNLTVINLSTASNETIGSIRFNQIIDKIEVEDLYVDPKMRNLGYGSKILNCLIEYAKNKGFDKIIFKKHKKMDKFLEKNMFVKNINEEYEIKDLKKEYIRRQSIKNTIYIMVAVNFLLILLKLIIGYISKLDIFYFDAINSISDFFSLILSILGVYIGFRPILNFEKASIGKAKMSSIFSIIVGVMILIPTIELLINQFQKNKQSDISKNIVIVSISLLLIKLMQYFYLKNKNKKIQNDLLAFIELDYKTDIILSSTILLAVILSYWFKSYVINLFSILVAIYIIPTTLKFIYEKINSLLDIQDTKLLNNIKQYILIKYDVFNVHDIYMISLGEKVNVYADIRVDNNYTVQYAHDLIERISVDIQKQFDIVNKVTFHIEPIY